MLANFVQESANNPGTATTINLAGPATGRRGFVAAFGSGALVDYVMDDGTNWEYGQGTVTAGSPNTLTRTTVVENSLGTLARVNFTGAVRVLCMLAAQRVGWMLCEAPRVLSAVVQADFLLPLWARRYRLTLHELTVSTPATIACRFSSDGGATFLSTASYLIVGNRTSGSGGAITGYGLFSQTSIGLSENLQSGGANPFDGSFEIYPGAASASARVRGVGLGVDTTTWQFGSYGGAWTGAAARMNAIRIFASAGTMSGVLTLEGLR